MQRRGGCDTNSPVAARLQGVARCYTYEMPTKHPRHAITETGAVAEALADLRKVIGTDGFTLSAQQKLFQAELEARVQARGRERLANAIREGTLPEMDIEAADEVRRSGWVRPE